MGSGVQQIGALSYLIQDRGYPKWVFAFSGLGAIKRNHFEWRNTLESLPVNYALLRDDDSTWFHLVFDEVIEKFSKPDLCIGSSMGGYAALLFSAFWGNRCVAFCPQTAISRRGREILGDGRWTERMRVIHKHSQYPELFDLQMSGDQYRVVYCDGHGMDVKHAERLNVIHLPQRCKGHNVAGGMAETTDWKAFFEL